MSATASSSSSAARPPAVLAAGVEASTKLAQFLLHLVERLDDLGVLFPALGFDELRCDCSGEHGDEADADEHHEHPDHSTSDRLGVEIPVPDSGDGHNRPPDAVPDAVELLGVKGRLCSPCDHDEEECDQGDEPECGP